MVPHATDAATLDHILAAARALKNPAGTLVWLAHLRESRDGIVQVSARRVEELTGLDARSTVPRQVAALLECGYLAVVDGSTKPRTYSVRMTERARSETGKGGLRLSDETRPPVDGAFRHREQRPRIAVMLNKACESTVPAATGSPSGFAACP